MKGSIKIHHAKATQLCHCVISSLQHQYGVEEKLNESPKWLRASSQYEVITAPLVNSTHYKVIYHYHNFGYDENEKRATKRADTARAGSAEYKLISLWSPRIIGLVHGPFTPVMVGSNPPEITINVPRRLALRRCRSLFNQSVKESTDSH